MGTHLEQHIDIEPGWPEFGEVYGTGEIVRLADVETLFEVGSDARSNVFFWQPDGDNRYRVWPWRESWISEIDDETGEEVLGDFAGPDVPHMHIDTLRETGLDDEKLEALRKRMAREHPELRDLEVETKPGPETMTRQARRRATYDAVMRIAYG